MSQKPNPYYPLPVDYGDLTDDGKKQARLATLRRQNTPQEFVEAWALFRNLYLRPRGDAFYQSGFKPSPDFHYQMIHDLGAHARNAQAAPRGFGKSIVIGIEVPLLLTLTRPYFSIAMAMATDKLIDARFGRLMLEYEENPYILNDFGKIKPPRGSAKTWNHHRLQLHHNGSLIEGFSVMGRKRGARPLLFIMDDPEFDSDDTSGAASSQYVITEKYERILFRQIIPMLAKGSAMFWVGTMINRRCLLYKACEDDDPRFKVWMRRVYKAEDESRTKPLWESAWSLEFLKAREAEMGSSAYSTEYLNAPLTDETKLLHVDPTTNEYNIPEWHELPPEQKEFLLTSKTPVEWNQRVRIEQPDGGIDFEIEQKKEKAQKLFGNMYKVAIVDTASGLTGRNDYRAVVVLGYDHYNCLWVLDLWMGRCRDSQFYPIIYKMARRWMVRAVGIEAFATQISLVDSMSEYVADFTEKLGAQSSDTNTVWVPRIVPIKPPLRMSKGERISTLEWRFQAGKIKYPRHLKNIWPVSALYDQTENFTVDLALLRFDDAIDTVALSNFLIHTRGQRGAKDPEKKNLLQQIKDNEPVVPGIPLLSGVSANMLTEEQINQLFYQYFKNKTQKNGFMTRPKPRIIIG